MLIGIIAAMDMEADKLKGLMTEVFTKTMSKVEYSRGKLFGKDVVVAVSGIGKVSAAMCAQTMILTYKPDIIINTGIAGGVGHGVKITDIVVATEMVQHDMDITAFGVPIGHISSIDKVYIPCAKRVLDKLEKAARAIDGDKVHIGVIATGDQFVGSAIKSMEIAKTFNALATEMEGASIGQVCYTNDIEFGVIRVMSDCADDNAVAMDYQGFSCLAADKSINVIKKFLEEV